MIKITEKQRIILEAVAYFKYLTTPQLKLIFNDTNSSGINQAIRGLKVFKSPPIKSIDFGLIAGIGRLSKIHYLTKTGAEFLVQKPGASNVKIQHPNIKNSFFHKDYFHRIASITFSIRFHQWLLSQGGQLLFYKNYFNRQANTRCAETQLNFGYKTIIPDGLALFKTNHQNQMIIFEQHNGKDIKRAINQMLQHTNHLETNLLKQQYQLSEVPIICYVFEHAKLIAPVMKRIKNEPRILNQQHCFMLNSQQSIEHKGFSLNKITF